MENYDWRMVKLIFLFLFPRGSLEEITDKKALKKQFTNKASSIARGQDS